MQDIFLHPSTIRRAKHLLNRQRKIISQFQQLDKLQNACILRHTKTNRKVISASHSLHQDTHSCITTLSSSSLFPFPKSSFLMSACFYHRTTTGRGGSHRIARKKRLCLGRGRGDLPCAHAMGTRKCLPPAFRQHHRQVRECGPHCLKLGVLPIQTGCLWILTT